MISLLTKILLLFLFLTYLVSAEKAEKFCTICGCGKDPTGVPTGVPTPSPPDDECKGGKEKIDLKNGGEKKCNSILTNELCDEIVKNTGGETARKFCTSCGCGGSPVRTLTVSPPDDDCKGDEAVINLTKKGPRTCGTIFSNVWCGKKVEGGGGGGDECAKCTKAVPKFVKNNQFATEKKRKKCVKMCTKKKNKVKKCDKNCCIVMCDAETTEAACIKTEYCAPPVLRLTAVSDKGSTDRCGEEDWVNITNTGNTTINLTGYILYDDKGVKRPNSEAFTFDDSYSIEAGANMTLCKDPENGFPFGIGGDDTVTLLDADGKKVDTSGKLKDEGKLNYVWTRISAVGDWKYMWTNGTNVDL